MRTLRLPLALATLLLLPAGAAADYSPPPLNDLVLASDAIVVGEIVALGSDTFTLRVDEVVAGQVSSPRIEVERFVDWTCAARWAPYATGQRALIFLNARGPRWQIRSAGGEGEMPLVGDRVHVSSYYDSLAPPGGNAYAQLGVHGGRFSGFTRDRAQLVEALRAARACFTAELSPGPLRRVQRVRRTCDASRMRAARGSDVGRRLFDALERTVTR